MNIPREWQMLIAGSKLEPTDADCRYIEKELSAGMVDWDRVADRAFQHDIAPLMHRSLQRLSRTHPAPAAFEKLKSAYLANAARNSLLFRELQLLLRELQERQKPVIVLKGAALVETVYRDRGLRPMSDVDLLIRKEDLIEVENIMFSLGYALNEKQRNRKEWYYAHYHHFEFRKRISPSFAVCCEIHWCLEPPTRPFPIDMEGVWKRATVASITTVPALVMCPEDLLVFLCLHTCKHRLIGGFRSFCDIAEVVRRYGQEMDWNQVIRRSSEWQINTFVYVPLTLATQLLGAEIPAWIMQTLASCEVDDRLLDAAAARVFEDRLSRTLFPQFFQLRHGRSFSERASVIRELFSRDAIATRYAVSPEPNTMYRYYPRRLKDLMIDYGAEVCRFIRLGRQATEKAKDRERLSAWLAPFADHDPEHF
jgi:hypothetical protein